MDRRNIGMMVADVARLMRRSFDARARSIGVTRPQWGVLSILSLNEGINQGGLADLLEVEPITLCRMVDRLQDAELIERRRDPADRRAWNLYLSDKGRDRLEDLRPLSEELLAMAMDGVTDEERAALDNALHRIRSNILAWEAPAVASHG
ncbi:MarR family transcriptional regulator [Sphingobium sufflavum]|uniref:MarR family winged helix-turn-helix transcriptional regulator n=1 Tax=Sphingobium sufflavum TaxID=1129547 RepID=UPI001F23106F|nr:MarR family transcriptional regulator [Sphingobium sufflavum]MCE7796902.1 MarR family transcriptional regulator [Sphingobium sufflavum]